MISDSVILDLHSHRRDYYPEGVESVAAVDFVPLEGQLYSVGLHPWDVDEGWAERVDCVRALAGRSDVVAVGEAGLDGLRGGPMWLQLEAFKAQARIADEVGKPLVVHAVRTHDVVASLRRRMKPRVPWVIHGFSSRVSLARVCLDAGCMLSFGERFQAEVLRMTPAEKIFAETDESALSIEEVIARLSAVRGENLTPLIASNTSVLLGL